MAEALRGDWDLVVVGAGTAGLPCALAAAQRGARVLLLEKMAVPGGTLHVSGGHMSGGGTSRQRARGIVDDVEAHWADVLRISRGRARPDLARRAVELAPAVLDWLDAMGMAWDEATPRIVYGHEPYQAPRTVYGVNEGRSLLELLLRLLQPHVASGEVALWTKSPLRGLVAEGRRIVEAEVERDGAPRRLRAPAFVLATGGYASAPDLFAEIDGRPLVSAGYEGATGDGLRLAREVGATIVGAETYLPTFGGLPHPEQPGKAQWGDRPLLVAAERPPWEVYVDRRGRRFVSEDEPSMDRKERALADIEDLTFFAVFDDRAVEASPNIVVGWSAAEIRSRAGRRAGVLVAPSLAALAAAAGIDAGGLRATISRYNEAVDRGHDPEHGRRHLPARIEKPPFYALENHGITLITFAGLDVDSALRVRRGDGSVFENLYAAGEVLGAGALMGDSFCSGMMVGPALAFGRLLGERLGSAQ